MTGSRATDAVEAMSEADYQLPAELFVARRVNSKRGGLHYHRFVTAAEAIEFAGERYSSLRPDDLVMSVGNKRFNFSAVKLMRHRADEQLNAAESGL